MNTKLSRIIFSFFLLLAPSVLTANQGAVIKLHRAANLDSHLKSGKIVILMASASYCTPCKEFLPQYEELARENPDVIFLYLEADTAPDFGIFSKKYAIPAFPTFIYFDKHGNKVTETGSKHRMADDIAQLKKGTFQPAKITSRVVKPHEMKEMQPMPQAQKAPVTQASCPMGTKSVAATPSKKEQKESKREAQRKARQQRKMKQ